MFDMKIANRMLVVRCTYCNKPLFKTKAGIDMHLKSHQRKGLINVSELIEHKNLTRHNLIKRIL